MGANLVLQERESNRNPWKPGKWMAFVYSTGENMYYYIIKDVNKPSYLIYSVICACRKNIGTAK